MPRKALVLLSSVALASGGCGGEDEPNEADKRGDAAAEKSKQDSDGDGVLDLYDDDPGQAKPTADPQGNFETKCDYLLADDIGDANKFIAGGSLTNTGNVGIVARLTARWQQLGGGAVRSTKTVRIREGGSREVQISLPATNQQIDAHQSADGDCRTSVKIVDTFGEPNP